MYPSRELISIQQRLPLANWNPACEPANLEALFAAQAVEGLSAGEALVWEGDGAAHAFEIVEGCLRLCRLLPDGRRAIVGFAFAGELLGLTAHGAYTFTAEAVTKVRVRRLSKQRFHAAVDGSAHLRALLFARMCEEAEGAHQHLVLLGRLAAEERVVNFLLSAARRTRADRNHPVAVELPMSRLDMADYLGMTIETVSRIISKLKRDGLLSLEGRHTIVLRALARLRERSGGLGETEEDTRPTLPRSARHWAN